MKRSEITAGVMMALGTTAGLLGTSDAEAVSISITQLVFSGTPVINTGVVGTIVGTTASTPAGVSGTFTDGGMGLLGSPWAVQAVHFWDTPSVALAFTGLFPIHLPNSFIVPTAYSYTFHLTGNQVAFGLLWDWAGVSDTPILAVFDCAPGVPSSPCTPVDTDGDTIPGTAMTVGPVFGFTAAFSGHLTTGTIPFSGGGTVPIPTAAWLFGSGLVGLGAAARRKRPQSG